MEKLKFLTLDSNNIDTEHICCAFASKEAQEGYILKKDWLKNEFNNGYVFRRLNARAKVFIEYVPTEKAWIPVDAPNYLSINCLWVSGQYKGQGYAKALLQEAINEARTLGLDGLITVVGVKKFHFMGDGKWFLKQGFKCVDKLPNDFVLLAMKLRESADDPQFNDCTRSGICQDKDGLAVYYSNRCPFTEYQVNTCLVETARLRSLPLKIVRIKTLKEAQSAPTPGTIFSLFYNGKFITTDVSVCMDSRFDKILKI